MDIKVLLEGASALPYDDTIISVLKESSLEYLSDNICEKADALTPAFVCGQIDEVFKDYIINKLEENGCNVTLTDEVFCRLSEFAVVSSIQDEEDEEKQALAATIVMNYMIVAKGHFEQVPNNEYVKSIYAYHLSKYLASNDLTEISMSSSIYERIANKGVPDNAITFNEDELRSVRCALKESLLYRIDKLLRSEAIQSITNLYVRVFSGLKQMMNLLPCKYYNLDVSGIVSALVQDSDKSKRRKLGNIITDLQEAKMEYDDAWNFSSVILSLLNGNDKLYPPYLKDEMLSVGEFAIYLYYEMLVEILVNN